MKKEKLIILMVGLAVFGIARVDAQSRKEKIELLTHQADSLTKVLSAKNESLVQLQIKLARIEGATDAHNEVIKSLGDKVDSLKELLVSRNLTIENQASKIAQLNTDIGALQAQQKEWTSKNELLNAELANLKKPADTSATVKDVKAADPPKEEVKPANIVSDNKPNTVVKNQ